MDRDLEKKLRQVNIDTEKREKPDGRESRPEEESKRDSKPDSIEPTTLAEALAEIRKLQRVRERLEQENRDLRHKDRDNYTSVSVLTDQGDEIAIPFAYMMRIKLVSTDESDPKPYLVIDTTLERITIRGRNLRKLMDALRSYTVHEVRPDGAFDVRGLGEVYVKSITSEEV